MLGIEGSTFTSDTGIDRGTYGGKSLVLDGSADYLSRTFSASSATTWTFEAWVKLSDLTNWNGLFEAGTSATNRTKIYFYTDGRLEIGQVSTTSDWQLLTSQVFRDFHKHYHIVIAVDTTQGTAANRVKLYVDGEQVTAFDTETYPSASLATDINVANAHYIGRVQFTGGSQNYLKSYISKCSFIDGTQYAASAFGHTSTDTGKWVASDTSGLTFGTNGFSLDFNDDRSGTPDTTTTIYDQSSNSNNWTGTSLTAGSFRSDTPVDNYATLNVNTELDTAQITYSIGNTWAENSSVAAWRSVETTIPLPSTGKFAFYVSQLGYAICGVGARGVLSSAIYIGQDAEQAGIGAAATTGTWSNGVLTNSGFTPTDTIRWCAVDMDTGKIWLGYNGSPTWIGGGDPVLGTSPTYTLTQTEPWFFQLSANNISASNYNIGFNMQGAVASIGGVFKVLSSANLPVPDELYRKPQKFADIALYEGTGGTNYVNTIGYPTEVSAYETGQSLELDGTADYLSRTFGTPTDNNRWTFSCWAKKNSAGSIDLRLFQAGTSNTNYTNFSIDSNNNLAFVQENPTVGFKYRSDREFEDTTQWHHYMVAVNTDAASGERVKIYVDGVLVTSFSSETEPSSALATVANSALAHTIGRTAYLAGQYANCYIADIHFVDGSQLTPSSFGEFDAFGFWKPKEYVNAGTGNSFYLPFDDATSTTTLGEDNSTAGTNDWTLNSLAITDQTADNPSNNHATLSIDLMPSTTAFAYSNGNRSYTVASGNAHSNLTMALTGKKYFEILNTTNTSFGIWDEDAGVAFFTTPATANGVKFNLNATTGGINSGGVSTVSGSAFTWTDGDVLGIGYDADTDRLTFDKNDGTPWVVDLTGFNSSGKRYFFLNNYTSGAATTGTLRVESSDWTGTAPTDHLELTTDNLPDASGSDTIPLLAWIKNRDAADSHQLFDRLRGPTLAISSDSTAAEAANGDALQRFMPGGFITGDDVTTNTSGESYWTALLGSSVGAPSANTDGSISSDVWVCESGCMSVVTATMNSGGTATLGHGLGKAPDLIIGFQRNIADNHPVYHSALGATKYLLLDTTTAVTTSGSYWNNVAPTDSVFSVGAGINSDNGTWVFYAFVFDTTDANSPFTGGSYTGNGSADGTFVPSDELLMMCTKQTNGAASWILTDQARSPYNIRDAALYAHLAIAEGTVFYYDIISNGFKLRTATSGVNGSSQDFIWWGIKKDGGQLWA